MGLDFPNVCGHVIGHVTCQVSSQSKVLGSGGGHLLQRIVEQIEKTPLSITGYSTRVS